MSQGSANGEGLPWPLRVEIWDAALAAVRACLREAGMAEVSTAIASPLVALEPWIEPLVVAGRPRRYLATSPELAMKRLLCRGVGSIFQIAHVFRAAEVGAQHSEEFHLIEWYRAPGELDELLADVEAVIERVGAAVGERLAASGRAPPSLPIRWRRLRLLEQMSASLGQTLRGDETAEELAPALARVSALRSTPLTRGATAAADELEAWTELFSLWSDTCFLPWLEGLDDDVGIHVVEFPAALAALSEREPDRPWIAARFESQLGSVELANGYRELRDPAEQRRRFAAVARLRARHELEPLAMPEPFLAELSSPGLPACVGVALGLDRLLARLCGCDRLDQVSLALPGQR